MKTKEFIKNFVTIVVITLLANVLITLLWNYFIKNIGLVVDWETSFRMAIILGIVLQLTNKKEK